MDTGKIRRTLPFNAGVLDFKWFDNLISDHPFDTRTSGGFIDEEPKDTVCTTSDSL